MKDKEAPQSQLTQEAQWAQGPTPLWDLENIISFNIIKENMNLIHPRLFLPLQQCNHNSSFYFIEKEVMKAQWPWKWHVHRAGDF